MKAHKYHSHYFLMIVVPIFLLSLLLFFISSPKTFSQSGDCAICKAALVPYIRATNSNKSAQLAYLNLIDEETFREIGHQMGASVVVPIDGIPIPLGGDWAEFERARNRVFRIENYNRTEAESRNDLETYLPQNALSTFSACISSLCGGHTGIKVIVTYQDQNTVLVLYDWSPPPGATQSGIVQHSTLTGGSSGGVSEGQALPQGTTFVVNSRQVFSYQRRRGQPFVLSVTVNGTTDSISLPSENSCFIRGPRTSLPNGYAGVHTGTDCTNGIIGWAWDTNDLTKPLTVTIWDELSCELLATIVANEPSTTDSIHSGHYFTWRIPQSLRDRQNRKISVFFPNSNHGLNGTGIMLRCP